MLHQYFHQFGDLTDCVVIKNPATKLSRCFGFVTYTTPQIADHVVDSRPHIIDGKEIDVKHASAESHERHQQQLAAAAAAAATHDRAGEPSPDKQRKRSRWENQRNSILPSDMTTIKSSSHIAFIQRDRILYPIPLKYLRDETLSQNQDNNLHSSSSTNRQHHHRMYSS